jgi:hypothetical protein
MMSVVCDGRKELPAGVSREYSSYCGNYTYHREKLVTRVDAASDPNRVGGDQVRAMRFEGERMLLIPPPRRTGEIEEHREITWERIAGSSTSRLGHVTGDVLDHALLAAA